MSPGEQLSGQFNSTDRSQDGFLDSEELAASGPGGDTGGLQMRWVAGVAASGYGHSGVSKELSSRLDPVAQAAVPGRPGGGGRHRLRLAAQPGRVPEAAPPGLRADQQR